jgi:IS5 family transposase
LQENSDLSVKSLQNMLGKSVNQSQKNLFSPLLIEFIDQGHELVLLGNKMDWKALEQEFAPLYSTTGKPAMPVRFMAGCLMLSISTIWEMRPWRSPGYEPLHAVLLRGGNFQHRFPCDPSDFMHFRKRIGESGVEAIFRHSVAIMARKGSLKWCSPIQRFRKTTPSLSFLPIRNWQRLSLISVSA